MRWQRVVDCSLFDYCRAGIGTSPPAGRAHAVCKRNIIYTLSRCDGVWGLRVPRRRRRRRVSRGRAGTVAARRRPCRGRGAAEAIGHADDAARPELLLARALERAGRLALERARRLAGAERGSRASKRLLHRRYERVRAAEHALRGPLRLLERRLGLTEIVERGAVGQVQRRRVNRPHLERVNMIRTENTSRHGHRFAQQRLGFFEAL